VVGSFVLKLSQNNCPIIGSKGHYRMLTDGPTTHTREPSTQNCRPKCLQVSLKLGAVA